MASVATTGHLGIAPVYGSKCALSTVAFASSTHVMIIDFSRQGKGGGNLRASGKRYALDLLEYIVLCSPYPKYAFRMDNVALSLILDLNLPIVNGVDLLDLQSNRQSFESVLIALGGKSYHTQLDRNNVAALFQQEESSQTLEKHTALQAWSACRAAMLDHMAAASDAPKISTLNFDQARLMVLAKINRQAHRLTDLRPVRMRNEVEAAFSHKSGKLNVSSARFKNRIRQSGAWQVGMQTMEISSTDPNGQPKTSPGRVLRVNGRAATIAIQGHLSTQAPLKVTTIGREEPTQAEEARAMIILAALQQSSAILDHPFIQALWFPRSQISWATIPSFTRSVTINFPGQLNDSQRCAVDLILSNRDADRVTVIQGPPGTGKTTVIAAAVTSIVASTDRNRTLWLVAHSNVAVKNIAEKLASIGFLGFKILVSKDFHYDWHEHLYRLIESNLVRSDDFVPDRTAMERQLLDSRIILCTLSMLSNDRMSTIAQIVPVQTIIFDEASQIEVGDYLPVIHRFASSLRKMVFIGDHKQHRIPRQIGDFISEHVYNKQLKTVHDISSKICCRFVNVSGGREGERSRSWINEKEIQAVVKIAKIMQDRGKSFKVITPYDAQRSTIEDALKDAMLNWKDKCYNVDSFQGNEDDYIIVSVVRSKKLGFLVNERRGMIICSSRAFLEGIGSRSLIGRLAARMGTRSWVEYHEVLNGGFPTI
ncbi:P-loop containing nucleoside triphosphate hydrolase protein [Desarmillaria tabescens]|uniref:P-loop containing nucleoside triphosphate hydrolase protein n=1 Tax=Armillaria tabescens TaxID=1929756 RepID=A0AA39KE60_ARMTA|nr:P-loop containing nucleoside triphosphate hydrolase protein [Desarmillaria tabescens]KAK0458310.1 P-loop containing nucleoside triphosphate hydrolase protein [Desarmillaria tabescens]